MSEVKVLVEGYAKKSKDGWLASPSSVLIRDSDLNVLVDPGANKQKLLDALAKENMKPEDIDIVFLTHYHIDHLLNIRLFPDKDILSGDTIYRDDEEIEFEDKIPNTNIKIIETLGHGGSEHVSLLVDTDQGKIAVAGDVFWWTDDEEQKTDYESLISHEDPFTSDPDALKESRKKLLEMADYIIPGHGKMFRVER